MSFSQILAIVKARKILVASIFLLTILTTIAVSVFLPKQYTATAAVVMDVKSPDPISGMVLQGMMTPTYMATQVDILNSSRVAKKVIQELRLNENQSLRQQWADETGGDGDFEAWLTDILQKKLSISPSKESNVIDISYTGADPRFAAALANGFTKAFIDTSLELRVEPAKQYAALFDAQAKQQRDTLDEAQRRLSAYQKEKGIVATDERLDVESQRLQELTAQLVSLQSLAAESSSRKAQGGDTAPDVISNGLIASLKADLARQEAREKELMSRYGSAHPQAQEIDANVKELRERINQEIRKVNSSVGLSNNINQSREAQIRQAVEQQRQKILHIKSQRDEATALLRDIESAQRAYDTMTARFNQASLESQSTQTNVAVLKAATPPDRHSSPKLFINTVLSVLLGAMLALVTCFAVELVDRKVRGKADIEALVKLPILGELPKVKFNDGVNTLRAGAPSGRGLFLGWNAR